MTLMRPGGFRITEKALKEMNLAEGSSLLEIGCGDGDTAAYLTERGYRVSAVERKLSCIDRAKEKAPQADIRLGDGEFLDDWPSFSFDGVVMECVLSLIDLADEALHEAYCVLRKGGVLYLSDLMVKDPSPDLTARLKSEAAAAAAVPHEEGECDEDCEARQRSRPLAFRSEGRLLVEPLMEELKTIGYQNIRWEDFSPELDAYVAQRILSGEAPDEFAGCKGEKPGDGHKTGYFMLIAEKG